MDDDERIVSMHADEHCLDGYQLSLDGKYCLERISIVSE